MKCAPKKLDYRQSITVSIVSHGNQPEIINGGLIGALDGLKVVVRENIPECGQIVPKHTVYFANLRKRGFGANHNANFEAMDLQDRDWFVICNPDILTSRESIELLVSKAEDAGSEIAVPYLFNQGNECFDHNIRRWPTITSLAMSFLRIGGKCRYRLDQIEAITNPDWASGAMMAIRAGTYRRLNGFDEGFFLYMEDVDFCRRAGSIGSIIGFYPEIRSIHNAARSSKVLFSAAMFTHLKSAARYFWKYRFRKSDLRRVELNTEANA